MTECGNLVAQLDVTHNVTFFSPRNNSPIRFTATWTILQETSPVSDLEFQARKSMTCEELEVFEGNLAGDQPTKDRCYRIKIVKLVQKL